MRIFCQYSYNGFATFRINEGKRVKLIKVTPSDSKDGLPTLADLYFNYGGVKLLYRYLNRETLALIICGIPSPEVDTFDRPINCAVQFIGNATERYLLDSLAKRITENLDDFESNFSDMFDLVGGLYFESDKLFSFIYDSKNYQGKMTHPALSKLENRQGEVLLFVPVSDNFGIDPVSTSKTLKELQLPREAAAADRCIHIKELKPQRNCFNDPQTQRSHIDEPIEKPKQIITRSNTPRTNTDVTLNDSKKNKNQILYLFLGALLILSLIAAIIKLFF